MARSDDYQYRGKTLTFCSREQLIACCIEQHREIRTVRKQRDDYMDEAIARKLELETLRSQLRHDPRLDDHFCA